MALAMGRSADRRDRAGAEQKSAARQASKTLHVFPPLAAFERRLN
jgi:hypothetical protein